MILTTLLYGWSGQYLTWLIPKNYSMDVFYIANDVLTFTSGNPACSSSTLQANSPEISVAGISRHRWWTCRQELMAGFYELLAKQFP